MSAANPKEAAARLAVRALKSELRRFDKLGKEGVILDPDQRATSGQAPMLLTLKGGEP